jgi:hypothetical protein
MSVEQDAASWSRQQLQQLRSENGERRRRHIGLGVNDDVPSCGYLLTVEANHFAKAAANAIAHHRAAERALDAEAEAAVRQIVRFRENGEVGIGTALPMTVNRVEVCLAHEAHRERIRQPGSIRA